MDARFLFRSFAIRVAATFPVVLHAGALHSKIQKLNEPLIRQRNSRLTRSARAPYTVI
jgi:hypothetical protein